MTRAARLGPALGAMVLVLGCQAREGSHARRPREFDGSRAFGYVEQQMAFGPRIPGTPGHERAGDWLVAQFRARADTVWVQPFAHVTQRGDTLHLRNILARFRPDAAERVLFLAHWDTRPRADQSPNLAQQRLPVPGANDGASGVAVLLGVADALKAKPPAVGVDLRTEVPDTPVIARTDPGRVRQVVDGLCENALRAVPPGAPLVLKEQRGVVIPGASQQQFGDRRVPGARGVAVSVRPRNCGR